MAVWILRVKWTRARGGSSVSRLKLLKRRCINQCEVQLHGSLREGAGCHYQRSDVCSAVGASAEVEAAGGGSAEAARIAAEEEEAAREAQAQLHAATFIQSHIRGKLARGQYSTERAAVIRAQMAVRRWILRVKWTRAREAREEAERVAAEAAKAKAEGHAAVLIQSRVRGCSCTGSLREGAGCHYQRSDVCSAVGASAEVEAAGGGSAGSCAHRGGGRRGCA